MPVLSSASVMAYLPQNNQFTGAYGPLHFNTAPDWFGFTQDLLGGMSYDYYYSIDPVPSSGIGIYSVELYDTGEVLIGTISITITATTYDYEFSVCVGDSGGQSPIDNPPTVEGDVWQIYSAPSWFSLYGEAFDQSIAFVANDEGATVVILQASAPGYENYFMQILITASLCFVEYDPCERRALNIAWKNKGGGNQNYVFSGKNIYGLEIGSSENYKDENNILRTANVLDVRDSVQVVSGLIPKDHVIYLKLLKASIQAWIWDSVLDTFTPIVIQKDSFTTYEVGNNQTKYNFTFVYGEEIIIQNH